MLSPPLVSCLHACQQRVAGHRLPRQSGDEGSGKRCRCTCRRGFGGGDNADPVRHSDAAQRLDAELRVPSGFATTPNEITAGAAVSRPTV
jgi:hypothetical protein